MCVKHWCAAVINEIYSIKSLKNATALETSSPSSSSFLARSTLSAASGSSVGSAKKRSLGPAVDRLRLTATFKSLRTRCDSIRFRSLEWTERWTELILFIEAEVGTIERTDRAADPSGERPKLAPITTPSVCTGSTSPWQQPRCQRKRPRGSRGR